MGHLIEFEAEQTQDDQRMTILVEAPDDEPAEGQREVSRNGVLVEKASEAFDTALAGIAPIARRAPGR